MTDWLDEQERALLKWDVPDCTPNERQREQVWRSLAAVTVATPPATTGWLAKLKAFATGGKLGLVFVAATIAGGLAMVAKREAPTVTTAPSLASLRSIEPPPPSLRDGAPFQGQESPSPAALRAEAPVKERPSRALTLPSLSSGAPSPTARAREGEPSRLAEESALLTDARKSLRNGEIDRALATLLRHEQTFARGALVEEREALRVDALIQRHDPAARTHFTAFAERFPQSAHLPRLRTLTESEED